MTTDQIVLDINRSIEQAKRKALAEHCRPSPAWPRWDGLHPINPDDAMDAHVPMPRIPEDAA